jgi:hypothetical protein
MWKSVALGPRKPFLMSVLQDLIANKPMGWPQEIDNLGNARSLVAALFFPLETFNQENAMTQHLIAKHTRAGAFDTVAQADQAIRRLLAAGFSKDQLAVICPARFKDHFLAAAPFAASPTAGAPGTLAIGGVLGATLGGVALAATAITGGVAGLAVAGAFIGGGAIAGGFSNLIVSKGYEQEADDHYKQAVARGQIVVGVEVLGEDSASQLAEAQFILDETDAKQLEPV